METIVIPREESTAYIKVGSKEWLEEYANRPRTIFPRKRGYRYVRMAAILNDRIVDEDGADTADIVGYVRAAPPTIFITMDAPGLLDTLNTAYADVLHWQYKLAQKPVERESGIVVSTKLAFFGFREDGKRKNRYHQCWDMAAFSPTSTHKLLGRKPSHASLLAFGYDVRQWAQEQDLPLVNSLAGYSQPLLRDPRFYDAPRRRVPNATNDRAREALPGNLVNLTSGTKVGKTYHVASIDQRRAHHRIVQEISLPDANTLFARGYYSTADNAPDYWTRRGDPIYTRTIGQPGLLYAGVHSRPTITGEYRLRKQNFQGFRRIWVFTNEIVFMEKTGSVIEGIYAAWTSNHADTGLPKYAAWAEQQIDNATPERARWLKPLLHSTYGLLAASPKPLTFGYRLARSKKFAHFIYGLREFPVRTHTLENWRPATTNVIQRGMIEAETQIRSLTMAQYATDNGCEVTGIYTDCVHVTGQLPLIDDTHWKMTPLTNVMYIDNVSYHCDQGSVLPGRDAYQRRKAIDHAIQLQRIAADTHTGPRPAPVRTLADLSDAELLGRLPGATVDTIPYRDRPPARRR